MKRKLKTYKLVLKTFGPVFVGSGRDISKKEYMFLQDGNVAVFHIEKLYAGLAERGLQHEYEKFLLSGRPREDLRGWLDRQNISLKDVSDCVKYRLQKQDSVHAGDPHLQIMECIKDPYGFPYIPGSSVKGMLRTILLCNDILENPQKYSDVREKINAELFGRQEIRKTNRKQVLARTVKEAETKSFRVLERTKTAGDAVNDMLSGLIVSDSEPLRMNDLVLCQKIERHPDGSETSLPLLRECVRPGTEIYFSLTIDEGICSVSPDRIKNAIQNFARCCDESFIGRFADSFEVRENMVFLGGGSGFASKTMIYAMFPGKDGVRVTQRIFEKTGVPDFHKHRNDIRYGVSPHILKCTHYQGKTLPMGLCTCKIEE